MIQIWTIMSYQWDRQRSDAVGGGMWADDIKPANFPISRSDAAGGGMWAGDLGYFVLRTDWLYLKVFRFLQTLICNRCDRRRSWRFPVAYQLAVNFPQNSAKCLSAALMMQPGRASRVAATSPKSGTANLRMQPARVSKELCIAVMHTPAGNCAGVRPSKRYLPSFIFNP